MAVELTRLTVAQRTEVLRELERNGLHPAVVGDRAELDRGVAGVISQTAPAGVLVDGRQIATVGAEVRMLLNSAHGCPVCPHPAMGVIVTGYPNVLVNGRPIALAGSETNPKGFVLEGSGGVAGMKRTVTALQAMQLRGKLVRG